MIRALPALLLAACGGLRAAPGSAAARERTFWQLCWTATEPSLPLFPSDQPPYAPLCGRPTEVTWPELPVQYGVDESAASRVPAVLLAVGQWNAWLDRAVFAPASERVDLLVAAWEMPGAVGMTQLWLDRGHLRTGVVLSPKLLPSWEYVVVLHELGHVLGLSHDVDQPESLMHPTSPASEVSAADLAALRAKYRRYSR